MFYIISNSSTFGIIIMAVAFRAPDGVHLQVERLIAEMVYKAEDDYC